jgi:ABC-2 type transport system permease protein
MPMVLMILLIMAAQLAATSVAMEKEEKTLETLLTMPVSRSSILFGKISGVVVVSAIAVVAYIFGFYIYMNSMISMSGGELSVDLADIGLVPSMGGMVLLFVTLFLSLVAALSVAVLAAAFTEDVRSAQALMGLLYVPIFVPALVLMFVDISQMPLAAQGVILAIPFSYPILASKALYTGDFLIIMAGIVYQVIFTTLTIVVAARFFSSEKILTARFKLKGGKKSAFPIASAIGSALSRKKGEKKG